jgi:hypothetical protein
MRVISKFYDYYDNTGYYSEYPVYLRKTAEYTIGKAPFLDKKWNDYIASINSGVFRFPVSKYPVYMYVVGCCGKLYFIYNVVDTDVNYKPIAYNDINKVLDVAYGGNKRAIDDVKYNSRTFRCSYSFFVDSSSQNILELFDNRFGNRDLTDLFIKVGSPIFIIPIGKQNSIFTVNPVLIDYGFQHIVDPYTMHQEIEMYLGNVLVSDKDTPEFDDVLKRDMHGMDKWSFKKQRKDK